jgi:hypothetical protein
MARRGRPTVEINLSPQERRRWNAGPAGITRRRPWRCGAGSGVASRHVHDHRDRLHLRKPGQLPCGYRRQIRGVAPREVRDAYLVTAGLVELLAELVAVAVVEDSLEHAVASGLEL